MCFFFQKKKTQRIERIEPFLEITQRIELFFVENMTQRIELFFSIWLKELLQPFFFMIQIHGPFTHDSKNWTFLFTWLKYLNFFWKFLIQRNGPFFFSGLKVFHQSKITHRIDFFFESDPQNWFFFCKLNRLISWIWRKELNRLIFEYDAKNWTY